MWNFHRLKERAFLGDWVGFKAGLSYLSKPEKTRRIRENLFRTGGSKHNSGMRTEFITPRV